MLRPLPPETLLDRHLHRPPPPAHARPGAAAAARRGSAPGSRTSPTSPRRARPLERGAGRDGGRPRRHARPRGRHPGADPGAAASLADRRAASIAAEVAAPPRARDARGDPPRRDRAVREAAATTRPRCGRSPPRPQVQPAAIYHWYPNKEAILVHLQDDFMEQLTARVARGDGRARTSRRCGSRPRSASTSSSTGSTGSRRSSPTARSGRSPTTPRARADRQARRLPGDVRAADPRRDPRRLAALPRTSHVATYAILLQCTGVALWFDPAGPLALEQVAELHVELVLGSLGASAELIGEAIEGVAEARGGGRDEPGIADQAPGAARAGDDRGRRAGEPAADPLRDRAGARLLRGAAATRSSSAPTTARSTATSPAPTRSAPPTCSGR